MESAKKKILVIDDEPEIIMIVKSRLEANNYEVVSAANGKEGLEKIEEFKPDLVIVDLILPGLTGYDLCIKLKLDKLFDGPVIMLTANKRDKIIELAYRCGADRFISKPFSSQKLLEEVSSLLSSRAVQTG